MIAFDELMRRFAELNAAELSRWVENRWVVPETATYGPIRTARE